MRKTTQRVVRCTEGGTLCWVYWALGTGYSGYFVLKFNRVEWRLGHRPRKPTTNQLLCVVRSKLNFANRKDAKILGKTENGWTKANNAALAAIIIAFKVKPFGWNYLRYISATISRDLWAGSIRGIRRCPKIVSNKYLQFHLSLI